MIYTKEAPKGKYLTQVAALKSEEERIFIKGISGASDTLDLDWRIATDDEVAAWEARKAAEEAEHETEQSQETTQPREIMQPQEAEQSQEADDILKYK